MPFDKNWQAVRISEKNTLLFELETEMLPKTN